MGVGVDVIGQLTLCGMMWAVGGPLFDLSSPAIAVVGPSVNGTLTTVATNFVASTL